ncbi:D-alanyl-D-alanine carboxypeptidase/D-alanyl-D-alanine endopeptidase [Marseilla massiliensis]|uniref:D-alanyl-D-alanine carboxypeptidase/D-alanyl-D-alanine-endopeptidase n=1 Tax=Marseilla massiliensis TaxID=1841864 RepID=A0A938WKL9_9BACT|nr:D-alanyl-D-alanine carboxypeptidase/D-alanyl-D-alanine-endopeptidase [Marseilla massiliensis]MBM6660472.1 D-alanyl-D-alanine carboxypeptidase/D-alanyl-D-alanine-endopeptidase [Marseilla massiliensis]
MIPLLRRFASILLLALVPACLHAQDSVHGDDGGEDSLGVALADTTAADSIEALGEPAWPDNVAGRIDRLLGNELFNRSQVALMVYDLTADSAIYCHNERQLLRPASTMKVVTAIAAIDRLGGSFQFKTTLSYTGAIEDGVLNGDVYLVGGFDPRFNSDDMGSFVDGIRRMGIDTIRGRIVADKSMKDADMLGEGWCWDDDNPVLSPLLISRRDVFVKRFVDRLRDEGVVVEADTVAGRQPGGAYEVGTRTHTIDQVLMPMMKESDNLCAEALFYQLGASTGAHPATARDARTVVRRLVEKVGLRPSDYRIADGSGLSLYNYVTAELEVMLLRYAYQNTNIYMHLLPSLPVAGEDGTLRRRMRGTFTSGNVKAKTGSVTAISSLAGYCTAANGHVLCFAIINQGIRRGSEGRAFQDRVCEALCRP